MREARSCREGFVVMGGFLEGGVLLLAFFAYLFMLYLAIQGTRP
jgi:hypothetical protein